MLTAMILAQDYDGKVQVVDNQRISVTMKLSVLDAMKMAEERSFGSRDQADTGGAEV